MQLYHLSKTDQIKNIVPNYLWMEPKFKFGPCVPTCDNVSHVNLKLFSELPEKLWIVGISVEYIFDTKDLYARPKWGSPAYFLGFMLGKPAEKNFGKTWDFVPTGLTPPSPNVGTKKTKFFFDVYFAF